jgi:hypothetical protein
LVGNAPGNHKSAVASPVSYTKIWDDGKSGGKNDGTIWRPNAPSGYVSLGDVATGGYDAPSTNDIWCVREDLVVESDYDPTKIWDDRGSGARMNVSVWAIARPTVRVHGSEKIPVLADLFRGHDDHHVPPAMNLAKVLALPCPNDFNKFTTPPPAFTKETLPRGGDTFSDTAQCEVILPFTVFFPPTDRASLSHISNPFCTLAKRTAWYVHATHSNNSGGEISDKTTIKRGVSQTESTEMTNSAGVSVTGSYGIKGFGMEVSLNYQFTSTESSSYTEYSESSREQGFTVPPYHATVFLVRHVWLKASRSDGSGVLREIGFNANDDIQLVGVDLK